MGLRAMALTSAFLYGARAFAPPGAAAPRAPRPARSGVLANEALNPRGQAAELGALPSKVVPALVAVALAAALGASRRALRSAGEPGARTSTTRCQAKRGFTRTPHGPKQAFQFLPTLYPPMLVDPKVHEGGEAEDRGWTAGKRPTTVEEIEDLNPEDVPTDWKSYYSPSMIIRDRLMNRIKEVLEETYTLVVFNFDGITHVELDEMRKTFPKGVVVRQIRNTIVRRAMQDTPWEAMVPEMRGQNMYCFVKDENDLRDSIKAVDKLKSDKKFDTKLKKIDRWYRSADARNSSLHLRRIRGSMIRDDWTVMLEDETIKLKDFPTKLELIAQIAGAIKQVPTKIAKCTKQLPQKMAVGMKKIVEKMEEEGKATVGDLLA